MFEIHENVFLSILVCAARTSATNTDQAYKGCHTCNEETGSEGSKSRGGNVRCHARPMEWFVFESRVGEIADPRERKEKKKKHRSGLRAVRHEKKQRRPQSAKRSLRFPERFVRAGQPNIHESVRTHTSIHPGR